MRSFVPVCALLVTACGSEPVGASDAGADSTNNADAPTFGDGALPDLGVPDVPSITLDGGGPFLCFDCICNGADHFCLGIESGDHHNAPFAGDASMCSPDAAYTGCLPIPAPCKAAPSCACLLSEVGQPSCNCELDPSSGNGLVVGCVLP